MCKFNLIFVSFLLVWQLTYCQRRITDGRNVTSPKRYMVYLIKTTTSPRIYDFWLCGGALVKPEFVVTSAACVMDIQFMFVIAGLYKYYPNVGDSECANKIKKRVIMTYRYAEHDFEYDEVNKWANLDIAVAQLETPYKREKWMEDLCDFVPGPIAINYDLSYEEPGEKVMALGWGHSKVWRSTKDTTNLNHRFLKYTSTEILPKETCKKAYDKEYKMSLLIGKYMICADKNGGLNDKGEVYSKIKPEIDPVHVIIPGPEGCITSEEALEGVKGPKCGSRRSDNSTILMVNSTINITNKSDILEVNNNESNSNAFMNTRRYGICQNDHGGPLVAWVDGKEKLIGIASVFLVTQENECAGPYLYTSTSCTNVFLRCVIEPKPIGRRSICDKSPKEKGFHTIENEISWKGYTEGSVSDTSETPLVNTTNPTILNITNKT